MPAKLSFLGAARNVTGSKYLLDAAGKRLLVDCGMYQEREFKKRNWEPFPVPPSSVDAVLLTHAHLDHVGYLPRLAADGFRGPVHCTAATAEIAKIVIEDSGHIQEYDAARKRRRHAKQSRRGPHPVRPLYTQEDARRASGLFRPTRYGKTVQLGDGIEAAFRDAGHIFGSSMLLLKFPAEGGTRTVVFSGDVGRWDKPILRDPTLFDGPGDQADYVVTESTYGDRVHGDEGDVASGIAEAVNASDRAGGNLLVPSFSVERAHEIMYHLNSLFHEGRIPPRRVFIDSPMAIRVTEVFKRHPELYDEEMSEFVREGESPFKFPGLTFAMKASESKAINKISKGAIIIAGSGMCTGGRIKHHLIHGIERPETIVLFTGYQARGTLGREILGGRKEVRILGRRFKVRAKVMRVEGFSGHADRDELFRWLSGFKGSRKAPRRVFVTHGEDEAAEAYGGLIRKRTGWEVEVPHYRDEVALD